MAAVFAALLALGRKENGMKRRILYGVITGLALVFFAAFIFFNSAQSGEDSAKRSGKISETVAVIFVPGFREMPEEERSQVLTRVDGTVRKCAHMAEFMMLAFAVTLFMRTFSKKPLLCGGGAFIFSAAAAAADEWHQSFVMGRGAEITDVLTDCGGALLGAALGALLLALAHRLFDYLISPREKRVKNPE